jgi:energy-coupling factor transport system permease protein
MQAALLAARLLALGLIFFFWLSTTDQGEMVRGFVALKLPYEWGLTLALALRYLPILAGLMEQVREAQAARGLDLAQRGFAARLRAYGPILVAVIIGALRHGERLGWALESRALGAGPRRTEYRPLRLRSDDVIAFAGLALILLGAILLRLL